MSCLRIASRAARAQDSFRFRVSYDLSLGADTAPPFFMPLRDADSYQRKPKKMSRRIRFRNYPKAQNPHYILLLRHNTGRTFLPFDFARQDVRFWAGERGNALTPHDPARRAS